MKTVLCALTAAVTTLASLPTLRHADVTAAEETKLIALTFDDGPNTTTTNQVLDILEQYNAKATFFLIGNNITDESAVSVKRAYDMGCEIGNHSKTHSNMSSMTVEEIQAEIDYVDEKVLAITGETTTFFRAPFIDTSQMMYDTIEQTFICGIDCQDYMANVTAQQRADYILGGAKDGIIVLLHDAAGNDQTVEALEIVMPQLIEQGYEFVTLTELFERQGETPNPTLMYTQVAKYPCSSYELYENLYTGSASGDGSWSGWSETAVLDRAMLKELGADYAIEVACESTNAPVIALQKWSGASIWSTVAPFYYNGKTACFLAEDILAELDRLGVDYTDLDRMTIMPHGSAMTMTQVDILVKSTSAPSIVGDVNTDGQLSIADAVMLRKWLSCNGDINDWNAGDLDKNGQLNAADLSRMKQLLLGS